MDKKKSDSRDVNMRTTKEEETSAPIPLSSGMKKKKITAGERKGSAIRKRRPSCRRERDSALQAKPNKAKLQQVYYRPSLASLFCSAKDHHTAEQLRCRVPEPPRSVVGALRFLSSAPAT
jgi:hypothetical protein